MARSGVLYIIERRPPPKRREAKGNIPLPSLDVPDLVYFPRPRAML